MEILVISLYPLERNTSVANSSISIINGLILLGYKITIMMPNWIANETLCSLDNLHVVRIPGKPNKNPNNKLFQKLHSHFDFLDVTRGYLKTIKIANVPDRYYDIILSLSDPKASHIYAAKLIRKKKIRYGRWIQHWGDPITGDFTRHYWWPDFIINLYERHILRMADKSVFVTPFTCEMVKREHIKLAHKISFVPLPAEMRPTINKNTVGALRVSYLGDYNPSIRNLKPLYDACANKEGICLTIAGYGPKYPHCDNVTILSRIPQSEARQIEDDSDVLVCVCNITGTMIPGKIMYKASTNKHILVAIENNNYEPMKAYFNSFNRYILCRNDAESISTTLDEIKVLQANYSTPENLLPENVAKKIIQ